MKRGAMLINYLLATIYFFSIATQLEASSWIAKISERKSRAIVLIQTYKHNKGRLIFKDTTNLLALGSGFFIDEDTIVTNNHVIEGSDGAFAKTKDEKIFPIEEILVRDENADLAILRVSTFGEIFSDIIQLEEKVAVEIGDEVIAIGNPQGWEGTVTKGIVSAIRVVEPYGNVIQMDAAISPGSSGGPVFNKEGELIGISTFFYKGGQDLNFVIPAESLFELRKTIKEGIYEPVCNLSSEKCTEVAVTLILKDNDLSGALCFTQYALLQKPKNVLALHLQGACFHDLGYPKHAINIWDRANSLSPNDPTILYYLAGSNLELRNPEKASQLLKEVIRLEPLNVDAHITSGACFESMGELDKAEQEYIIAKQLKPTNCLPYRKLGLMYESQKNYKKAAEYLKKASELNEMDSESIYRLGMLLVHLNRRTDALKQYKKLMELNPEKAETLFESIHK